MTGHYLIDYQVMIGYYFLHYFKIGSNELLIIGYRSTYMYLQNNELLVTDYISTDLLYFYANFKLFYLLNLQVNFQRQFLFKKS